jgi:hypothetical protein
MENNSLNRLKRELESFKILAFANKAGTTITLAFAIAFGIDKVNQYITGGPMTPNQTLYLMLSVSGFVTIISWITRSSKLMESHDEITENLNEIIKNKGDKEAETGIIVKSLAFYRENQEKINQLKWGGRITGTLMLITGIPRLLSFMKEPYTLGGFVVLAQGIAMVSSFGVGVAAWYVPVIITRFTETWDARLSMADDANEKLRRILEDDG